MADTIRVKSNLPVALRIAEPHPAAERPGDSPVLRQAVLQPGVNEGVDADLFTKWAEAHPDFVATTDDVKAGVTDGKVFTMTEDEPEAEYGFEVALARAAEGENAKLAGEGSTIKDRPVTAEDQRPVDASLAASVDPAPVLAGAGGATVKTPANDANLSQGKPAEKVEPAKK